MKQRKTVSFLMVLFMMIGMLPLTAAPAEAASTTDYPTLTKLVDGCELMYNRRITVYDNGKQVIESIGPSSVSPNQRTFVDEKNSIKNNPSIDKRIWYCNGVIQYWSRTENDFLDLSELKGMDVQLTFFADTKLSAIYAPGVNLKIKVCEDARVRLSHSTRYGGKSGFCTGNAGAVIDLAVYPNSLQDCGSLEILGYGKFVIDTQDAGRETSPDYGIVARNTAIQGNVDVSIYCGNSYREVVNLIVSTAVTIDTTRTVGFVISNRFAQAAAWGCHMNNFKVLNAESVWVKVYQGKEGWKIFGDNGESDPVRVFQNYRNSGQIGSEWWFIGTDEADGYRFKMYHREMSPVVTGFRIGNIPLKQGEVTELSAGKGYSIIADVQIPEWIQKLKDADRVEIYTVVRLWNAQMTQYEQVYIDDFYLNTFGQFFVECTWICIPTYQKESDSLFYSIEGWEGLSSTFWELNPLYRHTETYTVNATSSFAGGYISSARLVQAGGEFREETKNQHEVSVLPSSGLYLWRQMSTGWYFSESKNCYVQEVYLLPRKGYQFGDSVQATINVNDTIIDDVGIVRSTSDEYRKYLYVKLRVPKEKGPGLPIKNQSGDFTIMQGTHARLFVIVGNVSPSYQWQVKNGDRWVDIPGETYYDYRAEPEEIGKHVYRCKLTNSYGEVGYSNEMTVTVLENVTLGRTPAYILPAVNEAAPDPATLWPDKVIDVYDLQKQTFFKKDEYNVPAGSTFCAEASYSVIPGDEGYILEFPSGTQQDLYCTDYGSDEVDTAVKGTITYKWDVTKEVDQWGFPTNYTEIGTESIVNIPIPDDVETYWARLTITNTIGTGDNTKYKNSYVEITFNVTPENTGKGTISGNIVSYGANDPVSIQLIKDGMSEATYETVIIRGTQSGNFYTSGYSFRYIPVGTYTMRVLKKGHVPFEYIITIGEGTTVQNVQLWLYGDVDRDGKISITDATEIQKFVAGLVEFTDEQKEIAKVTGNNNITITDATEIQKFVAGIIDSFGK